MRQLKRILVLTAMAVMLLSVSALAVENTTSSNKSTTSGTVLDEIENSVEKVISGFDTQTVDEKVGIKTLDASENITISKEVVFIAIIAGILLLALCVIFIAVAASNSSRVRKLEKDNKMYEEENAKRSIREEQLARRLMENQKRAHDEKWLKQRAVIEDNKRKAILQQAIMDERRLYAARTSLIDVLKKVNSKKRLDALCEEQNMLLEEQPWLRADRD